MEIQATALPVAISTEKPPQADQGFETHMTGVNATKTTEQSGKPNRGEVAKNEQKTQSQDPDSTESKVKEASTKGVPAQNGAPSGSLPTTTVALALAQVAATPTFQQHICVDPIDSPTSDPIKTGQAPVETVITAPQGLILPTPIPPTVTTTTPKIDPQIQLPVQTNPKVDPQASAADVQVPAKALAADPLPPKLAATLGVTSIKVEPDATAKQGLPVTTSRTPNIDAFDLPKKPVVQGQLPQNLDGQANETTAPIVANLFPDGVPSKPTTNEQANTNEPATTARGVTVTPVTQAPAKQTTQVQPKTSDATTTEVKTEVAKDQSPNTGGSSKDNSNSRQQTTQALTIVETAPQTATTESTSSGHALTTTERTLVVKQVADKIELLTAARPKGGVTVHLSPADFGSVTLVVKMAAGKLDAHMTATNDAVRDALATSKAALADSLMERGISLGEMSVAPQASTHAPSGMTAPQAPRSSTTATQSTSSSQGLGQSSEQSRGRERAELARQDQIKKLKSQGFDMEA